MWIENPKCLSSQVKVWITYNFFEFCIHLYFKYMFVQTQIWNPNNIRHVELNPGLGDCQKKIKNRASRELKTLTLQVG